MKNETRDTLIMAAAGASSRMKRSSSKIFIKLDGVPILVRALEPARKIRSIKRVIVAVRKSDVEHCRRLLKRHGWHDAEVIAGGASRGSTVWRALQRLDPDTRLAIVHDGARPFASTALWRRVINGALEHGAAIPVLPVTDTIKRTNKNFVTETLPRSGLVRVQTPQAFDAELLISAYENAGKQRAAATDDAWLVEQLGHKIFTVPGHDKNIKITFPSDISGS